MGGENSHFKFYIYWILISIFCIFASSNLQAKNCKALLKRAIVDKRVGHLSQFDEELRLRNLFSKKDNTSLCGPVCLVNFFSKLRALKRGKAFDPVSEVNYIVHELNPIVTKANIKDHGILTEKLALLSWAYFAIRKLPVRVEMLSIGEDESIPLNWFKDAIRADTGVILGTTLFPKIGNRNSPLSKEGKNAAGHFFMATGFDPKDPMHVLIQDPAMGISFWARLSVEEREDEQFLRLSFETELYRDKNVFVVEMLKMKLKKRNEKAILDIRQ